MSNESPCLLLVVTRELLHEHVNFDISIHFCFRVTSPYWGGGGLSVSKDYLSTIYFLAAISLFPVTCTVSSIARYIETYWLSEWSSRTIHIIYKNTTLWTYETLLMGSICHVHSNLNAWMKFHECYDGLRNSFYVDLTDNFCCDWFVRYYNKVGSFPA